MLLYEQFHNLSFLEFFNQLSNQSYMHFTVHKYTLQNLQDYLANKVVIVQHEVKS